jgi:hypothetical protein
MQNPNGERAYELCMVEIRHADVCRGARNPRHGSKRVPTHPLARAAVTDCRLCRTNASIPQAIVGFQS